MSQIDNITKFNNNHKLHIFKQIYNNQLNNITKQNISNINSHRKLINNSCKSMYNNRNNLFIKYF